MQSNLFAKLFSSFAVDSKAAVTETDGGPVELNADCLDQVAGGGGPHGGWAEAAVVDVDGPHGGWQ